MNFQQVKHKKTSKQMELEVCTVGLVRILDKNLDFRTRLDQFSFLVQSWSIHMFIRCIFFILFQSSMPEKISLGFNFQIYIIKCIYP